MFTAASGSVTPTTGASMANGRVMALTGVVTFDVNTITRP
jgi:hypothetical protein